MGDPTFICEVTSESETAAELRTRIRPQVYKAMTSAGYEAVGEEGLWRRSYTPALYIAFFVVFAVLVFLIERWIGLAVVLALAFFLRPKIKATVTYEEEEGEAVMRVSGRDDKLKGTLLEIGAEDFSPTAD